MTAKDVVDAYMMAFATRDHEQAKRHLAPDLAFVGPIDTFDNADDYLESTKRLDGLNATVTPRKTLVDGSDILMIYDMEAAATGTSRIAQWFHVDDDRITSIEIFFDAGPFRALMAQ